MAQLLKRPNKTQLPLYLEGFQSNKRECEVMALRATKEILDHERRYTVEEFATMPESEGRFELIDGKLVEKPVAKYDHNRIVRLTMRAYDQFDPNEEKGEIVQNTSFRLSGDTAPEPDISFYTFARRLKRGTPMATTPDLAIEVQSLDQSLPSLRKKIGGYMRGGVKLSWLIIPSKKLVEIYRPGQAHPDILGIDDTLDGEDIIPGFRLPIADLFE